MSFRATAEQVERKPGTLLSFKGSKAIVRFHDGMTYGLPAVPFKRLSIAEGARFVLVVRRVGRAIIEVRVERPAEARPARPRQATPKVYLREGRKLATRKPPFS